jgi:hypothetical protein
MAVLEHPSLALTGVDEAAARRDMREQIARLERDLGIAIAGASPWVIAGEPVTAFAGPRLLSLGELEAVRDSLADRLSAVRGEISHQADIADARRVLLEKMLADPRSYKWFRIREEDTASCRSWHVRPRYGLIGMLAGWWHVKVSSGCPLVAAA